MWGGTQGNLSDAVHLINQSNWQQSTQSGKSLQLIFGMVLSKISSMRKLIKMFFYFCFWEQKASSSKSQGQEVSLQLTLCLYEPSSWLLALQGSQVQGNRVLFAVATCGTYYIPNLGATICDEATVDNIHHAWFPISNSALITRQLWIYSQIFPKHHN